MSAPLVRAVITPHQISVVEVVPFAPDTSLVQVVTPGCEMDETVALPLSVEKTTATSPMALNANAATESGLVPLPLFLLCTEPTAENAIYATAMHRHLEVAELYMNPTVSGDVVDPFDVVGAVA